jgi:Dihydrodipicolinate synthase/N-acetylneuraminate lyase
MGKNGRALGKVITAMVTPFDDDRRINFAEVERLVEHLIQTGSGRDRRRWHDGRSPTLSR